MSSENDRSPAATAILTVAQIKATAESFDRGELNVFVALDAIVKAVRSYQAAALPRREAA